MDIREYLQTKEKGFYKILCNSMTIERQKQFYDAVNEWHESELKLFGIANVRLSFLEEVRKKWGESDIVEFDEWVCEQLNEA